MRGFPSPQYHILARDRRAVGANVKALARGMAGAAPCALGKALVIVLGSIEGCRGRQFGNDVVAQFPEAGDKRLGKREPDGTLLETLGKEGGITLGELQRTAERVLGATLALDIPPAKGEND